MLLREPLRNSLLAVFLAAASLFVWFGLEISSVLHASTQQIAEQFTTILAPRSPGDAIYLNYLLEADSHTFVDPGNGRPFELPGHLSRNHGMGAYSPRFHPLISLSAGLLTPKRMDDSPYNTILFEGECVQSKVEEVPGVGQYQMAAFRRGRVLALHQDYPPPKRIEVSYSLQHHAEARIGERYLLYLENYQVHLPVVPPSPQPLPKDALAALHASIIASGSFASDSVIPDTAADGVAGPGLQGEATKSISLVRDESVLTIEPLDRDVDSFLGSEASRRWREKADYLNKVMHAAELLAVEDPEHLAAFKDGRVRVVAGRGMTQEELAAGAQVCIMSAPLARQSGLAVGDPVAVELFDLNYANYEHESAAWTSPTLPRDYLSMGQGNFTIVGLYSLPAYQQDYYSFTQSSMFVPVSALSADTLALARAHSEPSMNLSTLVFKGREISRFRTLSQGFLEDYGLGFLTIGGNFERFEAQYEQMVQSVQLFRFIALPVWATMAGLYLILFWFQGMRKVALMRAQGMSKRQTAWQIFLQGLVPALPAAGLMLLLGPSLMRLAAGKVLEIGMSALVDQQTLAATAIVGSGAGVQGTASYLLMLFGALAAALFLLSRLMAGRNIMALLRFKE